MDKKNPNRSKNRKEQRPALKEWLAGIKSVPCTDCGVEYPPCVMQFDHVRGEKRFNIGQSLSCYGLNTLLSEIAKCDIVCSNCHALRTWDCG